MSEYFSRSQIGVWERVKNWEDIQREYLNKWVSIADQKVLGVGNSATEATENGKKTYPDIPEEMFHLVCVSDPYISYAVEGADC